MILSFCYAKFRENKTLSKISEFTVFAFGGTYALHPSSVSEGCLCYYLPSAVSMKDMWLGWGLNLTLNDIVK